MDTNREKTAPVRFFEVDVAKTLAIVFMVCVHVYEQLTDIDWLGTPATGFLRNLIEILGGPLAAPLFMFAMGIGMACTRHNTPEDFFRRGIRLMLGGFVLNFFKQTLPLLISQVLGVEYNSLFTPLESMLISDILHFAGLSFILTGLLKKLRIQPFATLILALLMQMGAGWASATIEPTTMLSMVLGFFVFTGRTSGFPLLLWFIYPAAGMVFAGLLQGKEDRRSLYLKLFGISAAVLASLACCLIQNGYDLRNLYTLFHEHYYAQDLFHSLFAMSLVLMFLSLAYFAFRGLSAEAAPMRFFHWCGKNLNKIYVIQWLLVSGSVAATVLLETGLLPLKMVIPVGVVYALVAIGLCALWNKLREQTKKA